MRRTNPLHSIAATLIIALFSYAARADLLYYGGDGDPPLAQLNQKNFTSPDDFQYDDFEVPAGQQWSMASLFGTIVYNNATHGPLNSPVSAQAYYEIRTGVSAGNGGSLLFSGTAPATSDAGAMTGGYQDYLFTASPASPITLAPGTYWLALAPIDSGANYAYIRETDGTNGIGPTAGDVSSYSTIGGGAAFVPQAADLSIGVTGTASPVPEPGAIAAVAATFALLMCSRSRKGGTQLPRLR
ncbi:MAG TPA: hypothetical protein VN541_18195 [Tepidisphaeraceae bacterium]|nr:hypothetical protein [Tepidisphaeraceae bacterium]